MNIWFLGAANGKRLTKTYTLETDTYRVDTYPQVYRFHSYETQVSDPTSFAAALQAHAAQHHCLLKGTLTKPLINESRKNATAPLTPTSWICFDIDGDASHQTPQDFITAVLGPEFARTTAIWQPSCSMGLTKDTLSGHIFYMLNSPVAPSDVKNWMTLLNLTNPSLRSQLRLNALSTSLRYTLDRTVNQNDKLIYISPPICTNFDPPQLDRFVVLTGEKDFLDFTPASITEPELQLLITTRINELRTEQGLPEKTLSNKLWNGYDVAENPDKATIHFAYERGPFTYVNLNGGDSNAYYYITSNPTILFNFKGEPNALLADIDPAYAQSALTRSHLAQTDHPSTPSPYVIHEYRSDQYMTFVHDEANDKLVKIAPVASKDRLKNFLNQYNAPMPTIIEDWDVIFDPTVNWVVNREQRILNRYSRPDYIRRAIPTKHIPYMTNHILNHVCAGDTEFYNHFLNWLGFIFQRRTKTGTAFLLQGTEGTGKGLLYNRILRPLLGPQYCAQKTIAEIQDKFNEWKATMLLICIAEARIQDAKDDKAAYGHIKHDITEPTVQIRIMRQTAVELPVYYNYLFTTNNYDALEISPEDRRFNVGPRQQERIEVPNNILELLEGELQSTANFFMHMEVNEEQARTALNNSAKAKLRLHTQNSSTQVFEAFKTGNLQYFVDELGITPPSNQTIAYEDYQRIVRRWITDAISYTESTPSKEDLRAIYQYLQNPRDLSTNKFARMLQLNELFPKRLNTGTRARVFPKRWICSDEQLASYRLLLNPTTTPRDINVLHRA